MEQLAIIDEMDECIHSLDKHQQARRDGRKQAMKEVDEVIEQIEEHLQSVEMALLLDDYQTSQWYESKFDREAPYEIEIEVEYSYSPADPSVGAPEDIEPEYALIDGKQIRLWDLPRYIQNQINSNL